MGILDRHGRLFGKLNVIDALVVILLIGLMAAAGYRFTASGMTREADSTARYTIMIEGVREFTILYYQAGLRAFDARNGEFIGLIAEVRYEPLTVHMPLFDGSVVLAERTDIFRVFVDIEASARETDTAILIEGAYELNVGRRIHLNTKFIDVEGIIVSAEIID